MMPSAPTAAAARDSGSTRRPAPEAWGGATVTGRGGGGVGPRDGAGARRAPVARGVRRVDDDRQVRVELEPRDRAEVEREARGRLEGPDAALAQHQPLVALLEDVVGGHQQLVERRGQPALEQDGLAELARD